MSLQKRRRKEYIGCFRRTPLLLGLGVSFCLLLYFGLPPLFKTTYHTPLPAAAAEAVRPTTPEPPKAVHLTTPQPQKAIYMTACVAGNKAFRENLVKLIDETELNSLVIDVKDYSGYLSFKPDDDALDASVSKRCMALDMKDFIKKLHDKGIYVIGRITVFQDPVLTKRRPDLAVKKRSDGSVWKDYKGLSFTDPGSKEVWDYIVAIAKASYAIGFDELNFDYVRFPSDGPMGDIAFTWSGDREKSDVLEDFFTYLSEQLHPAQPSHNATAGEAGPAISADLFGMTTTNSDDLNIGQVLEKAAPHFDFIAPMVYPSHYPPNFHGHPNPNDSPYEVVKFSMDEAVKRFLATTTVVALAGVEPLASTTPKSGESPEEQQAVNGAHAASGQAPPLYPKKAWHIEKLRPWLQDFDYGGNYDIAEVKAQIQAVYDAGLTSWMLWAPSNKYTRGALLPE